MSDELVYVFIPPLASILAHAERERGEPLSEAEVVAIRDKGVCMAMRPEHALELERERGFRDVDPENCWADWHRLRVETTGRGYLPKIVLCVVGGDELADRGVALLRAEGIEHELRGADSRMARAFDASELRTDRSLTDDDRAAIAAHTRVLYVLSPNFGAGAAPEHARRMLALGARLLDAGGAGMKCESSGLAHGRAHWLELAASTHWAALIDAYVQRPIRAGDDLYTCGMHLIGRPDLIGSESAAGARAVIEAFDAFALYLVDECPDGQFRAGHTFRRALDAPRFRVTWEPCSGYAEDDFFFNPFGRWRFTLVDA